MATDRRHHIYEALLKEADKALSGSASNIENIELQDLSGVVNSALRAQNKLRPPWMGKSPKR